ncbi:secretion protein HlyD [Niastella yeongjuensis]|uniref:Secretion protein HlyD n=1 Tax=Niastella yeongjuensis TaxID=354355 RepID=A0A1V9EX25_9BACT|nr:HlyD family secretion protein [Niastella yeongjuensis]OQP50642.1 secretion protein HlyD [Niastella yeongjuensis]SEN24755.1 membrane fusion protein, multidrug efflux system [Niastella yeongjuensis]
MNDVKKSSKGKKIIFPVILGLVLVGALAFTAKEYFYGQSHEETDNAQLDADISPVVTRATGYIKDIRFVDNQFVHAGDTLVVLDDRDFQIKLQQAQAALAVAKQSVNVSQYAVNEAKTGIATAQANIETAKVRVWKATEDFKRYEALYEDHAITKAQYDAAKAEKDAAEAALRVAQTQVPVVSEKVSTNKQQVNATASNIGLRQADIDYAKLQLSYTVITAPTDGVISKKTIQPGQLVQAGQALFSIVNDNGLYLTANFKETQIQNIRIGQAVHINIDAFGDHPINGTVESFAGATGAKFSLLPPDNATGNFVKVVQRVPVRIKLDKTDKEFINRLRPGLSAKVVVDTKQS